MNNKTGRYSWLIRPMLVIYDLIVINVLAINLINLDKATVTLYIYLSVSWLFLGYIFKFYEVYRFTLTLKIVSLLIKQIIGFTIILFAFFGLISVGFYNKIIIIKYLSLVFLFVFFGKLILFNALKKYRSYLHGNHRKVIIVGHNLIAQKLEKVFNEKLELGYDLIGVFSDDITNNYSGTISDSFDVIKNERIDEIYCVLGELNNNQVNEYLKISNENFINLKFVPNTSDIYSKRIRTDYYDYLPIISFQEVALNKSLNKIVKRSFDVLFSTLVIVFLLSWLIPLLAILIKLESRGPIFFKHKRNGLNYEEFICYKFRSLTYDKFDDDIDLSQVKREDARTTRVGKFIRKTSIDELPQFYNVLFGDMSVVGPRPHMINYTKDYAKKVDRYNFMFRHRVKQGITGLAQISGFRGEIKSDKDIINRIRYDVFYIENWSLLLDLKIIIKTVINVIKGEDKAY